MNASPPGALTAELVARATDIARDQKDAVVWRAFRMLHDPEEKKRLAACACVVCFYASGRMAGQAFTHWTCAACGAGDQHHNTAVPRLCAVCAEAYQLCRSCCADLSLRSRRGKLKKHTLATLRRIRRRLGLDASGKVATRGTAGQAE